MKENLNNKLFARRIISITLFLSIIYAIVRYNIFGNVLWKDLPIFVLNKSFSLTSLFLLTLNFLLGPLKNIGFKITDRWLEIRKYIGTTGFILALIHGLMSLSIFKQSYYPVFFMLDGSLSMRGGLSLFGGFISFAFFLVYYFSFNLFGTKEKKITPIITSKRIIIYAMIFIGIHLFFIGYTGWTKFNTWNGGLPPISLISFTIFFLGLLINLVGRK